LLDDENEQYIKNSNEEIKALEKTSISKDDIVINSNLKNYK